MIIRGVELFLGLGAEGDGSAWSPLRQITSICGLTLEGGIEEDQRGAPVSSETREPARDPHGLRVIASNGQRVHGRTP